LTKTQKILLVVSILCMASLWIFTTFSYDETPQPKAAGMCPTCGQLLTEKDGVCQKCELKKARDKIEAAARGGEAPKEEPRDYRRLVGAILVTCILLYILFGPKVQRYLRKRTEGEEIEYWTFNCFRCRRKLRFRATLIGTQGKCPGCKEVCTFPNVDTNDEG
jgi:hypothetical protein